MSKRYIPECIQYLHSCIYLALDLDKKKTLINDYHLSLVLGSFKKTKIDLISSQKVNELQDLILSQANNMKVKKMQENDLNTFK